MCVDVSTYGDLKFGPTAIEKCDTEFVKNCEERSEEVRFISRKQTSCLYLKWSFEPDFFLLLKDECNSFPCSMIELHLFQFFTVFQVCDEVTETKCEIVPYTKCEMTMEPTTYKSFEMNEKIFEKKVCTDGMDVVKHKKMLPECQNVTKQNCVTKWVYDDNKQPASAINLCFSTSSWPLFWPFFFVLARAKNKGGFTTKIPKILGWSLLSWYLFARFATNWFVCVLLRRLLQGVEREESRPRPPLRKSRLFSLA